jgi:Na+/phosphate symporter
MRDVLVVAWLVAGAALVLAGRKISSAGAAIEAGEVSKRAHGGRIMAGVGAAMIGLWMTIYAFASIRLAVWELTRY